MKKEFPGDGPDRWQAGGGGHFIQKLRAVEAVRDSVFCMRGAYSVRMGWGTAPGKTNKFRIDYLVLLYCEKLGSECMCHP